MGSGWYKVTLTAAASATSTEQPRLYSMDASNNLSYAAAGTDTYFWDQRFLAQSTTGSYVPTTTAAVTGATASANIDGASTGLDDGSATVTGNSIVVNTGNAKGLRLFFDSFSISTAVQLDFTVGLGAQLFFKIDQLLLDGTDSDGNKVLGPLAGAIDALTDQNTQNQGRIDDMLERLEIQRQSLLERFIAMEVALATADRIMESLRQTTAALLGNNN
jgi:flagellar hook-associated protein 2